MRLKKKERGSTHPQHTGITTKGFFLCCPNPLGTGDAPAQDPASPALVHEELGAGRCRCLPRAPNTQQGPVGASTATSCWPWALGAPADV